MSYIGTIQPVDAFVEWMIKGANIGLYFGIVLSKLEAKNTKSIFSRGLYTVQTMGTMGATLGTWYFFIRALERQRAADDGFNYGIGGALTTLILHRFWKIPTAQVPKQMLFMGIIGGLFGHYILREQNQ